MAGASISIREMIKNPGAHFDKPADVVAASDLSDQDKSRILDAWEEDARRLSVATEEGMEGGEPSRMADVADAKAELGLQNDERRPAPTKAG
jgi:hypothetical protein